MEKLQKELTDAFLSTEGGLVYLRDRLLRYRLYAWDGIESVPWNPIIVEKLPVYAPEQTARIQNQQMSNVNEREEERAIGNSPPLIHDLPQTSVSVTPSRL